MAKGNPVVRLTAETNDYERKMRQANKTFNDFMKGIGLSPAKFSALSVAIGGATAALKVAKDAFFKNEQNLDEWGRTVEASKSIYQGFLNALNTGDISGFLSNIDRIRQAAREAYDALDELATYNAFNKVNIAKARSGLSESIADYREGNGSKESIQKASANLIKELETKQGLQYAAYRKAVAKVAAERGVSANALLQVMTGNYGSFKELKNLKFSGKETRFYGGGMFGGGGSYQVAVPVGQREKLAQAVQQLNDTEIDNFQSLAEAAEMTSVEINNQRKQVARILNGRGGTTGGGGKSGGRIGGKNTPPPAEVIDYASDSIVAQEKLVNDLREKWRKASADLRDGYAAELKKAEQILSDMQNPGQAAMRSVSLKDRQAVQDIFAGATANFATSPLGGSMKLKSPYARLTEDLETLKQKQMESLSTDEWERYGVAIDNVQAKLDKLTGKIKPKEDIAKQWGEAANAIQSVGGALQTIEDPAAKVIGIVAQAIATVALAASQAMAAKDTTASGWAWIGAAAAITATMISTIAAIHSATAGSYAQGGVIPGNHYSGDMQLAAVNSGEVILNRAQVGNLASALSDGGGTPATPYTTGEQIFLGLTNYLKRTGRGEIVTTKR